MRSKCMEVLARGDGVGSVEHTPPAWGSAGLSRPHCCAQPSLARSVRMTRSWAALSILEVFHITKPVVLLGQLPLWFSSDLSQKKDIQTE